MSKIKMLSTDVISKISAGEVIQNPASIIKELIENSIDAMSTKIHVHIENGGKTLIKVSDNGCGLSYEDLLVCTHNHSTSKIISLEDLYSLRTLGMRGEALFSIETCAHLKIISKVNDSIIGFCYENKQLHECVCNTGTIMEVRDVFYNIPARQKFLKNNDYEGHLCEEVVLAYSLAYPDIQFSLQKNKKLIVLHNPIDQVFHCTLDQYVTIAEQVNNINFSGMLFNGVIGDTNYVFINKRWIKDRRIISCVRKAYKEISSRESIPFLLFITVSPDQIDVNVHPSKFEVKFMESNIYYMLYNVIKKSLQNSHLQSIYPNSSSPNSNINPNHVEDNNIVHNKIASNDYVFTNQSETNPLNNKNPNLLTIDDIININNTNDILIKPTQLREQTIPMSFSDLDLGPSINIIKKDTFLGNPIFQAFDRYIVCIDEEEMVFIDQHAAHERIISENLNMEKIDKQKFLIPIVLSFTREKIQIIETQKDLKQLIDFEINNNQLIIFAIPNFLNEKHLKLFLNFFFDYLDKHTIINLSSLLGEYIHEYGCRNSIRSGESLNLIECIDLINQLEKVNNNMFCNHGRRTYFRVHKNNLDKIFGRLKFEKR